MPYTASQIITINHALVGASDSVNFPFLFSGSYAYLATVANAGDVTSASGYDIIFTSDSAGTILLNWEIESYDPVTGTVNIWVKVPIVSHTVDTIIYVFYGNAAVTTFQGNLADANFIGFAFSSNSALQLVGTPTPDLISGDNGFSHGVSSGGVAQASFTQTGSHNWDAFVARFGAPSSPTYIQGANHYLPSATAISADAGPSTLGNTLIASIINFSGNVGTIADTQGNVWIPIFSLATGIGNGGTLQAWYVNNCKAGANTVTVSFATSASVLQVAEYSPLGLLSGVSADAGGTGITASASLTGSVWDANFGAVYHLASQKITDNFNRANGNLGVGNWTDTSGNPGYFQILSNQIYPDIATINTYDAQFWNAAVFPNDQYSKITLGTASTTSDWLGVCVRADAVSGGNYYYLVAANTALYQLGYSLNGGNHFLANIAVASAPGDVVELQVVGTTLTSIVNGVIIDSRTDAALTAGSPGVAGFRTSGAIDSAVVMDNWEGGSLSTLDSTVNANNGVNTAVTATTGEIDGAGSFNGTSSVITVPSSASISPTTTASFSLWVNPSSTATQTHLLIKEASDYILSINTFSVGQFAVYDGTAWYGRSGPDVAAGVWQQLYVTLDGTNINLYLNASLIGQVADTNTLPTSGNPLHIGSPGVAVLQDEIRISNSVRSADWILAEYNNQSSPSTFYTLTAPAPNPVSVSPTSGEQGQTLNVTVTGTDFTPSVTENFIAFAESQVGGGINAVSPAYDGGDGRNLEQSHGVSVGGNGTATFTQASANWGSIIAAFDGAAATLYQWNNSYHSGTSFTLAYNTDNIVGNSLVAFAVNFNGTEMTVADSQGNTWLPILDQVGLDGERVQTWYVPVCKAGTNSVIISYAGSNGMEVSITEYTPLGNLTQVAGLLTGTGTAITTPALLGPSTLSFSGTGITVNSYGTRNATTIAANVTIATNATLSARDVTVTNADTQTAALSAAFTVTSGAPSPASISPTSDEQGFTGNVTVTGTNFTPATETFIAFAFNGASYFSGGTPTPDSLDYIALSHGVSVGGNGVATFSLPSASWGANIVAFDGVVAATYVQGVSPSFTTATTYAMTYAVDNTAGNTLIVATENASGNLSTIADSQGNIWLPIFNETSPYTQQAWYAPNCKAGPNTVTLKMASSVVAGIAAEYTPLGNLTQVPVRAIGTSILATTPALAGPATLSFSGTGITVNSFAPSDANFIGFGFGSGITGGTPTLDVNEGDLALNSGGSSGGIAQASFTLSPSFTWDAFIARFGAPSSPTFVQEHAHLVNPATTNSFAYSPDNILGNTLIVTVMNFLGIAGTIADTQGNTWIPIFSQQGIGYATWDQAWYVPSCKAGPNTVTYTSASSENLLSISEYSPLGLLSGVSADAGGTGITATSPALMGWVANITIAPNAAMTARDVIITNANTLTGTLSAAFTVISGAPVPTSITPTSDEQGYTGNITVSGTNFDTGTLSFSGTEITVNSYSVQNATTITANISIASGAAQTVRDVTVTNADTQTATLAAAFTVTSGVPGPSGISPSSDEQGFTGNITVSGSNFNTATLSFSGTGITVNSYSVQNSTTVTANITIAPSAALTARDVVITNADTQAATLTAAFTVTSGAPVPISTSPASETQGATFSFTVTGTNFSTGTLSFSGTGITVNSYSVQNATTITANITVSSTAGLGTRDVTVTNADAQAATLAAAFTITFSPPVPSISPEGNIQSIFDSVNSADGAWFYVGKYSFWTLYGKNTNDGAVSVEASSDPNIQSNNTGQTSSASPVGVVICPDMSITGVLSTTGFGSVLFNSPNGTYLPSDDFYAGYIRVRKIGGVGGSINGNSLNAPGTGYAPGDVGTVDSGTGGAYRVSSVINGVIDAIYLQDAGTGYAIGNTGHILDGNNNAIYHVDSIKDGWIDNIAVVAGGSGYAVNDTGNIAGGDGTGYYVVTGILDGIIHSWAISAVGSGYAPGDTGTIDGGTGGTYSVTTVTGNITGFIVGSSGGTGYAVNDTGHITNGAGTGGQYTVTQIDGGGGGGDPVATELGSAANYAILAAAGVFNTGATVITGGNVGSFPTTGPEAGFTFTAPAGIDNASANAALLDALTAYNYYTALTPTQTGLANLSTNDGGGGAGIYHAGVFSGGALVMPSDITLDGQGDPTALFVFIAASTVTLNSGISVLLTNSAQAENVIWIVGSTFTSAGGNTMVGNILANTTINLGGGTLTGRALAGVVTSSGTTTISAANSTTVAKIVGPGVVTGISILAAGSGYNLEADLTTAKDSGSGDGGLLITITNVLDGVAAFSLTAPGSGYSVTTETTTATSGGGTGFTIHVASVTNGVIDTINYAPGANYSTGVASTSDIVGSGIGLTINIISVLNGLVNSFSLTALGTGYVTTNNPIATDDIGGTGTGLTLNVTAVLNGLVGAYTITAPGSGYTVTTETTTAVPSGGTGFTINVLSIGASGGTTETIVYLAGHVDLTSS